MNPDALYREIYHHLGILIVEKHSGLASQSTRNNDQNLYDILKQKYSYVALHHRLDRPASGLMLLCTDQRCNRAIAKAFRDREIKRQYMAYVVGRPESSGVWEMPIEGKVAESSYRLLKQYSGFAMIEVELKTGRTHQIRRHAQMSGHPILGDRRYGGAAGRLWPRLCLHAAALQFIHPKTQEEVSCRINLPLDMANLSNELG